MSTRTPWSGSAGDLPAQLLGGDAEESGERVGVLGTGEARDPAVGVLHQDQLELASPEPSLVGRNRREHPEVYEDVGVTRPPPLRSTTASPSSSPRTLAGSIRWSAQVSTPAPRTGPGAAHQVALGEGGS